MCLNKDVVQYVSHTQIAFERCYLVKSCCDASCKKKMVKSRKRVACKTTGVCTKSSTTFGTAWTASSVTMVSASLDAASRTGAPSMQDSTTNLDASMAMCFQTNFNIVYSIMIVVSRWHGGEGTLPACIRHLCTDPSSRVIKWSTIGYTFQSPVVRTDSILNSGCDISVALRLMALLFIQVLKNATFQQVNALFRIAGIFQTFLDTGKLLPWSAGSPDSSQIDNV